MGMTPKWFTYTVYHIVLQISYHKTTSAAVLPEIE